MLQMEMAYETHLNSLGRERGGEWGQEAPPLLNGLSLGKWLASDFLSITGKGKKANKWVSKRRFTVLSTKNSLFPYYD